MKIFCYNNFGDIMAEKFEIQVIGHIYNDYKEKFGIPRQSGLAKNVISKIIFENEFKSKDFFKGLDEFSHIWILWQFSETIGKDITPTVRPPKLGGNTRMGVFATRSPFRPNNIGLSSVEIDNIEFDEKLGTVIYVKGADIMNGTPIYDIKPYLPYTDIHENANGGFALQNTDGVLNVVYDNTLLEKIPVDKQNGLIEILSQDPRPSYQNDDRVYTMSYGEFQIKFMVSENELTIIDII